jgi:catechol 2,3-dioxygenase-like lactoylglutathione lyase family enzyme
MGDLRIRRLDNVGVAVRDIRRAMDFYTQVLGLEGTAGASDGYVSLGNASLYLFQTQAAGSSPVGRSVDLYNDPVGIDHLALEVDDIEQAAEELMARGVVFPGPVVGEPGEFRYRGFSDPDGNMLYIVQRAP